MGYRVRVGVRVRVTARVTARVRVKFRVRVRVTVRVSLALSHGPSPLGHEIARSLVITPSFLSPLPYST